MTVCAPQSAGLFGTHPIGHKVTDVFLQSRSFMKQGTQGRVVKRTERCGLAPHLRRQRVSGWLLLLLLWLIPLQFSWATVARYCQHEALVQPEQQHAGHHSHAHDEQASPNDANGSALSQPDADCHYCHASVAAFVVPQYAYLQPALMPQQCAAPLNRPFSGWIPPSIERPKWLVSGTTGMAKG